MAFPEMSEILERFAVLEQEVAERDITLAAKDEQISELAGFRQEALTAREEIGKQRLRIEELTDLYEKERRSHADARADADVLGRRIVEAEELIGAAQQMSESVRRLTA